MLYTFTIAVGALMLMRIPGFHVNIWFPLGRYVEVGVSKGGEGRRLASAGLKLADSPFSIPFVNVKLKLTS